MTTTPFAPMRTPNDVLAQVHAFAQADARVRAVLLTGSRTNPDHAPDLLSDFDLTCAATDVEAFAADESWLARFGAVLLMQRPDNPPPARTWLVVFADGARIDFTFIPLEQLAQVARSDSLTRVLLDKDSRCPPLQPPGARDYLVQSPTAAEFAATCNEFWWVLTYVAKGLWRGQMLYARHTLERIVRPELERVLAWYAGMRSHWQVNPGAYNKYLPDLLPAGIAAAYLRTFAGATPAAHWAALDAMAALMAQVAPEVAAAIGADYNQAEGDNAQALLRAIRSLETHRHG